MITAPSTPVLVLGAGAWGTALAILLARNGQPVRLWAHRTEQRTVLEQERCNARYLPGITFPAELAIAHDVAEALAESEDLLLAVPSSAFRATLQRIAPHLPPHARIAWATKGFESGTGRLLHAVARELLGEARQYAVISGPTFAREVALGLPTAITVAATHALFAEEFAARLHGPAFRAYTSDDIIGVEVGGALKNVLAIATGIADGLGFGANTRAALVTRGLAEMMRLGATLGARRETLMGLSGLGDLVLTCTDDQSRNRQLGLALARGDTLATALAAIGQAVEGVESAREAWRLAERHAIVMPIVEQVYHVLHSGRPPRAAVQALLMREQKSEIL